MRPKLTSITLRGFKTIRDLAGFDPRERTLLIGPNGAGKSNLVSFFRLLSWALVPPGQLQEHIARQGGANALLYRGASVTPQIEAALTLTTDAGRNDYGFRLFYAANDRLIFADESFRFRRPGQDRPAPGLGAGHVEPRLIALAEEGNPTAVTILSMLRRIIVYQFHNTAATARIRGKWDAADNRYLKEDGGNLGAVLHRLKVERPRHYAKIERTVRLALPFFASFDLQPDSAGRVLLQWREVGNDQLFSASQASDGMLRFMALVALLLQPEDELPDMLVLDEPELGLHPYAIQMIAGMIHSVSKHVQVLVATQSVSLIDRFEPDDIVVANRSADNGTTLHRLEAADLATWLETYTLSELWEKNVIGGRPSR